jgi:hypothetical protein
MPARLISLLLLVLTRDGVLHRFDGHHDTTAAAARATAIAALDGHRVAVLAGDRLTIDGRALPGHFAGVHALAGGAALWGLTESGVVRIDPTSGKQVLLLVAPHARLVAADGNEAFAEVDGILGKIGEPFRCKVPGRSIALAAGDGKLFVATKEGPLWEVDRASCAARDLKLGDWWGTLALAWADHALYAVTVAGKLWRIDPARREKTIVAMDGWQGAIDLSVLR